MTVDLSDDQLDALILVIESGCAITGPIAMTLRPPLLDALPKLQAARDRFGNQRYVVKRRTAAGTDIITPVGMEFTTKGAAEAAAEQMNGRALSRGEQTQLLVAQSWETRYFVAREG